MMGDRRLEAAEGYGLGKGYLCILPIGIVRPGVGYF